MEEGMSDGLMLRCGRCGDSMEWRVNDHKGSTELLIAPCRRCLNAAVGEAEKRHAEEVVAKYAASLAVDREIDPCPGCGRDLRDAQLVFEDGGTFRTSTGELKMCPRWTGQARCQCDYTFKGWWTKERT